MGQLAFDEPLISREQLREHRVRVAIGRRLSRDGAA